MRLVNIYVAPSDRHMLVTAHDIQLSHGALVHFTRPAIDPLFKSAAVAFRERVIGVVLSGEGQDGAAGLAAIKDNGGVALVQRPGEAVSPDMPQAALKADGPDRLPDLERLPAEFQNSVLGLETPCSPALTGRPTWR